MNKTRLFLMGFLGAAIILAALPIRAAYKARPWGINERGSYPANLTSEGVTIAVDPLYTDALAARVFDKPDMITRGIMPLAVIIFNDNEFPVEVDGLSVELIHDKTRVRTMSPNETVFRLFKKNETWISQVPIPRIPRSDLNEAALDDYDAKFLHEKVVGSHDKGGGFLYLHIDAKDLASYLSTSVVYIPNVYRRDDGSRMIFFEIALGAAIPVGAQR
jgi:hypothetical protein